MTSRRGRIATLPRTADGPRPQRPGMQSRLARVECPRTVRPGRVSGLSVRLSPLRARDRPRFATCQFGGHVEMRSLCGLKQLFTPQFGSKFSTIQVPSHEGCSLTHFGPLKVTPQTCHTSPG